MKQQLEVEVTQLRTNHAKLTGSYHAMVAIRDRQGQDNAHLSASNKELETRNKVLVGDKQFLLSKLEELSAECLHLANCEGAVKVSGLGGQGAMVDRRWGYGGQVAVEVGLVEVRSLRSQDRGAGR